MGPLGHPCILRVQNDLCVGWQMVGFGDRRRGGGGGGREEEHAATQHRNGGARGLLPELVGGMSCLRALCASQLTEILAKRIH